jgi:hypothetical protein
MTEHFTKKRGEPTTREFSVIHFIVEVSRYHHNPPFIDISKDVGLWHYEVIARIYSMQKVNMDEPLRTIRYAVDSKYYAGVHVRAGLGYRVYGRRGCYVFGLDTLEEAIEYAEDYLKHDLQCLFLEVGATMTEPYTLEEMIIQDSLEKMI